MDDNNTPTPDPAILIVEDSMEEALLVKVALAKAFPDIPITVAQDGDQGMALLQEKHWLLAIIDLNLPGTDGIEVIKAAQTFRPGLPIIAVTGYTSDVYIDGAYRAGADAVMSKPLDLPVFVKQATDLAKLEEPLVAASAAGPTVLAVGAKAGDVELGCGGILLKHRDQGHTVVVAIVGESGPGEAAAPTVAQIYGARVVFNPDMKETIDPIASSQWISGLVEEISPVIMYVPSERDQDPNRPRAQLAALTGGAAVPKVLGYQGPTSSIDFQPKLFVDIGPYMDRKGAVLRGYDGYGLSNVEPEVARATARYWGRFSGPEMVEPLEVLKG